MAVVSALNSAAVSRLKWTKDKIGRRNEQVLLDALPSLTCKILTQIESLCNMEGSWKGLRGAITLAIPPRIPYLGIYLMDLLFVDEGNSDIVQDNLINFEKRRLVYQSLTKIEESQKIGYNFTPVTEIEKLITSLPQLDEKQMYKKSLECEPRNCTKQDIM